MRRFLIFCTIICMLFLCFVGCSNKELSPDEKTAAEYIQSFGYKITAYRGEVKEYTLEKSMFYGSANSILYDQEWSVQKNPPDLYFGKEITVYGFTVENHPLEKLFKIRTDVSVWLADGKVIGGTSFPDQSMVGAPYSIDGKTLEEVTGMSYSAWSEMWKKKYGQ